MGTTNEGVAMRTCWSVGRVEGPEPMEALVVHDGTPRGLYRLVVVDGRFGLPLLERPGYPSLDMAEEGAPGALKLLAEGSR